MGRRLVIMMGLLSFIGGCFKPPERRFWEWFEENQERVFNFEKDQDRTFELLQKELNEVNPGLVFEIGPIEADGRRVFVISAAGIKEVFPAVESLHACAPNLPNWKFLKYRQRYEAHHDIQYEGKRFKYDEVRYRLFEDGAKVSIIVLLKGYNKKEDELYIGGAFLFLDQVLGEYDVATKISTLDFMSFDSKYLEGSKPLSDLAKEFDAHFPDKVH
jgi:hypothetical protein